MKISNAFQFRPYPVSFLFLFTYGIISTILIWIHESPPSDIPSHNEQQNMAINMTEAWNDLQKITTLGYHPYNSKVNDQVRQYLLSRIKAIIDANKAEVQCVDGSWFCGHEVELFDDMKSNVTIPGRNGLSVHFEGTNIIVYIHGKDEAAAPVLVNAHYDSVSTGYGATDDGMAVVSVLQLLSHFTHPRTRKRKRGLIALLNNGEEDYLNGAHAFTVHPVASLPKTFLNLEGAGAGGRATLFRSTDAEVTEFYKSVKHPFGSVMSADGFKKGAVKSETDYKVFYETLGIRGLDVAFWWPRSRYHTAEDDVPHTLKESLWHMLGTSISALESMMEYAGDEFDDGHGGAGKGTDGVWFDIFGRHFVLMKMNTAFIITICLLIAPPIFLGLTILLLARFNKLYLFSNYPLISGPDERLSAISDAYRSEFTTKGWRGSSRYPFAFLFAGMANLVVAHLLAKFNPFIVYSSLYAVCALHISLWIFVAWAVMSLCDWYRPSALNRVYTWLWQFVFWWVAMVYVAVLQSHQGIGGGYFVPIFYTGAFLAAWVGLLEMFSLKPISSMDDVDHPQHYYDDHSNSEHHTGSVTGTSYGSVSSEDSCDVVPPGAFTRYYDSQNAPTEDSPLFPRRQTFQFPRNLRNSGRRNGSQMPVRSEHRRPCHREYCFRDEDCSGHCGRYGKEQYWSRDLPSWTWIVQFLVAVPFPLIIAEQMGLFFGTAVGQTGADGNNVLTIHMGIALLAVIAVIPCAAFIVRVSTKIPLFFLTIAVGTLIYNLMAFPFSQDARLKLYFQQTVTPSGHNHVHLIGPEQFVESIIRDNIPSAAGKPIHCEPDKLKKGLTRCSWEGLAPNVVEGYSNPRDWANVIIKENDDITNGGDGTLSFSSRIKIVPRNTRACKIFFEPEISTFYVHHSNAITATPPTKELRLWSREWDRGWTVDVNWDESADVSKKNIQVVCEWSDVNSQGVIPAFDEVKKLLPAWAVVSKASDGLVELWL